MESFRGGFSPDIELTSRGQAVFKRMDGVYKYLRHHYILKRSVVFLVDSNYDGMANRERALSIVSTFFDSMSPADSFGLLHIGTTKLSNVILETKGKNTSTKRALLDDMMDMSK